MLLVGGEDAKVSEWAGLAFGMRFVQPLSALGIVEPNGLLRGAAIFNDFVPGGNIELTLVGPRTLTRGIIRGILDYAFTQCGATRMTCKTRRDNVIARKLLPKFGFTFEGVSKRYWATEKGGDALRFVLFKDDAKRWLGH